MSEGLLMQVIGSKRVWLFHPSLYDSIPLHAIDSAHDRQSTMHCIHHPNTTEASEFIAAVQSATPDLIKCVELHAGDMLYLTYGWFHHIESCSTSMSMSYRWHPYERPVQQHATTRKLFARQSGSQAFADTIYSQQVHDDPQLPAYVKQLLLKRVQM